MPSLREFLGLLRFENKASAPLRQAAASTKELGTAMAKTQVEITSLDAALKAAGSSVAAAARQAGLATKDYGEFRKSLSTSIQAQGSAISANKELTGGLSACAVKSKIAGEAWQQYKSGVVSTNVASTVAVDKTAVLRQEMGQLELQYRNAGRSIFTMRNAMVGLGLVAFIRSTVEAASSLEQVRFRLTALTGSVGEANKRIDTAIKLAARVPATLQEVQEAAAVLESFGANSNKWIEPVVDLSYVMGVTVPEAARSFGRAFAGGVGAADVFRERGILTLIRDTNGLNDLTSLTLPKFRQAMEHTLTKSTQVAGAATRAISTWQGQVSLLQDAWFSFRLAIADSGVLDSMKAVVRVLAGMLKGVADFAKSFAGLTGAFATSATVALGLTGVLFGLEKAMIAVRIAQNALKIALGGGWLKIAAVAVTALAAGFYTWWQRGKQATEVTGDLRKKTDEQTEAVKRSMAASLKAVQEQDAANAEYIRGLEATKGELEDLDRGFRLGTTNLAAEKQAGAWSRVRIELARVNDELDKANKRSPSIARDLARFEALAAIEERGSKLSAQREESLGRQQALNDKNFRTLHAEAGIQTVRADLMEEQLKLEEERAQLLDPGIRSQRAFLFQQEETNRRLREQEEALRRGAGWISSWGDAWKGVSSQLGPAFKEFAERPIEFRKLWVGFFDSVQQSTANWVDAWLQGVQKGKDAFKSFTKSILASFRQLVAQIIAQGAMARATGALGGLFGFPAAAGAVAGTGPGQMGPAPPPGQQGGFLGGLPGVGGYSGLQVTGAVAGAAIAYQGYRQGNVAQGAAGGALAGFSLGGPVGAVVGGVVGAAGGLLGKAKKDKEKGKARTAQRQAMYEEVKRLQSEVSSLPPTDRADAEAALQKALWWLGQLRVSSGGGNSEKAWAMNMAGAQAAIDEAILIINHSKAKRAILNSIRANFGGGMASRATTRANAALLTGGLSRAETGTFLRAAGGGGGGGGGGGVDVGGVNVTNNIQATVASDIDIQQLADRLGQGVAEQLISAIPAV